MDVISDVVEAASTSIRESESQLQTLQPDLYVAATKGNIQTFGGKDDLQQIVTDISQNTILHIHIKSRKRVMVGDEIIKHSEKETKIVTKLMDKMLRRPPPKPLDEVTTEFVREIIHKCPSLSHQINAKGDTPLHFAARFGHSDIAELLLQHTRAQNQELESGTRGDWKMLTMRNEDGNTALHEALRYGNEEVVKILTKDADRGFSYFTNNSGETPLYLAASYSASWDSSSRMTTAILESCTSPAYEGPNGKTALHVAAMNCNPGIAEAILLKKWRLTKQTDNHGWTPLHYAAYYNGHLFATRAVKALLEDDRSAAYVADKDRKMTPLHLAAGQGHIRTIKQIISHCPECYDMVDNHGWNFLHFALVTLSEKELNQLFENYPFLHSLAIEKDVNGNTPLHVAAALDQSSFVYRFGNDVQAVNNQNISSRDILIRGGCPELKQQIEELTKDVGNGQYPRGVIGLIYKSRKKEFEECMMIEMGKTREAHLVVATLIATVTFAAAFTLPGGYHSEKGSKELGSAILRRNLAFQAFVVTDAIAMTCSLSAVFIHLLLPVRRIQKSPSRFWFLFSISLPLTMLAMGAMVIAFVTGTYAVLAHSLGLALATCFIGLTFFCLASWVLREFFRPAQDIDY